MLGVWVELPDGDRSRAGAGDACTRTVFLGSSTSWTSGGGRAADPWTTSCRGWHVDPRGSRRHHDASGGDRYGERAPHSVTVERGLDPAGLCPGSRTEEVVPSRCCDGRASSTDGSAGPALGDLADLLGLGHLRVGCDETGTHPLTRTFSRSSTNTAMKRDGTSFSRRCRGGGRRRLAGWDVGCEGYAVEPRVRRPSSVGQEYMRGPSRSTPNGRGMMTNCAPTARRNATELYAM